MRNLFLGILIGVAIAAGGFRLRAQVSNGHWLAYTAANSISAALAELGATDGNRPVLRLEPYRVLAEHRVATKNPAKSASVHKDAAELYYVIEGSATLVTGRTPGERSGGTTQQIQKGDVLIIPENTPHWFSAVDKPLSYISMHMPRSRAAQVK